MRSNTDAQSLLENIAGGADVDISIYVEEIAHGVRHVSVADPHGQGAPISLFWSVGESVVVHIGDGGARLEEPLDADGAARLIRILEAVFLGESVQSRRGPVRALSGR